MKLKWYQSSFLLFYNLIAVVSCYYDLTAPSTFTLSQSITDIAFSSLAADPNIMLIASGGKLFYFLPAALTSTTQLQVVQGLDYFPVNKVVHGYPGRAHFMFNVLQSGNTQLDSLIHVGLLDTTQTPFGLMNVLPTPPYHEVYPMQGVQPTSLAQDPATLVASYKYPSTISNRYDHITGVLTEFSGKGQFPYFINNTGTTMETMVFKVLPTITAFLPYPATQKGIVFLNSKYAILQFEMASVPFTTLEIALDISGVLPSQLAATQSVNQFTFYKFATSYTNLTYITCYSRYRGNFDYLVLKQFVSADEPLATLSDTSIALTTPRIHSMKFSSENPSVFLLLISEKVLNEYKYFLTLYEINHYQFYRRTHFKLPSEIELPIYTAFSLKMDILAVGAGLEYWMWTNVLTCTKNCVSCSKYDQNFCETCDDGYELSFVSQTSGFCKKQCTKGYYLVHEREDDCAQCHHSCLYCDKPGLNGCSICGEFQYLHDDGSCRPKDGYALQIEKIYFEPIDNKFVLIFNRAVFQGEFVGKIGIDLTEKKDGSKIEYKLLNITVKSKNRLEISMDFFVIIESGILKLSNLEYIQSEFDNRIYYLEKEIVITDIYYYKGSLDDLISIISRYIIGIGIVFSFIGIFNYKTAVSSYHSFRVLLTVSYIFMTDAKPPRNFIAMAETIMYLHQDLFKLLFGWEVYSEAHCVPNMILYEANIDCFILNSALSLFGLVIFLVIALTIGKIIWDVWSDGTSYTIEQRDTLTYLTSSTFYWILFAIIIQEFMCKVIMNLLYSPYSSLWELFNIFISGCILVVAFLLLLMNIAASITIKKIRFDGEIEPHAVSEWEDFAVLNFGLFRSAIRRKVKAIFAPLFSYIEILGTIRLLAIILLHKLPLLQLMVCLFSSVSIAGLGFTFKLKCKYQGIVLMSQEVVMSTVFIMLLLMTLFGEAIKENIKNNIMGTFIIALLYGISILAIAMTILGGVVGGVEQMRWVSRRKQMPKLQNEEPDVENNQRSTGGKLEFRDNNANQNNERMKIE